MEGLFPQTFLYTLSSTSARDVPPI